MSERSEAMEQHAMRNASPAYRAMPADAAKEDVPPGYKRTEVGVIPEDWECVALGAVTDLLTGFPFPSSGFSHDGALLVRGSNVKRGNLDWDEGITRHWKALTPELSRYRLEEGDLVIAMDGALVGRSFAVISKSDLPALLVQRVARIRSAQVHQNLIAHWVAADTFADYVDSVKTHTAIPHISPGDIRAFFVAIPKSPYEQRAIATSLSDTDALIESLDRLIAKKRAVKRAAMQQLLTGKTRLPGFTGGAWHKQRLGDVLKVRYGRNQRDVATPNGAYPILASGGEIGRASTPIYDKPSVLIGRKGTIDEPYYASTPFWAVDTLFFTEVSEHAYPKYLYYAFCMIDWMRFNEASGLPSLSARTIEGINVTLPEVSEQIEVAKVLTEMDAEIEALERRRDKTRQVKRGMMQQLLTGRVRLVEPVVAA